MKRELKKLIKGSGILKKYGILEESYLRKVRVKKDENMLSVLLPTDDFCAFEIMKTEYLKSRQAVFFAANKEVHELIKSYLLKNGVKKFEDEGFEKNGESFFLSDDLFNL